MSSRLRIWALRSLLALIAIIVMIGLFLAYVVGTESGTRWALGRVSAFAPVDIDAAGASGTLSTNLAVPEIRYSDADRNITIRDVALNLDWGRSSLSDIVVEQLAVRQFSLQNIGEKPAEPEPLVIAMPALPVEIHIADIELDTLIFDELNIANISALNLAAAGHKIEASHAAASVDRISVEIDNLAIKLDGDVPVSGAIAWRIADTPWSGEATISGNLKSLELTHNLAGEYPAHTEGTVQLLQRTEPFFELQSVFDNWGFQDWTLDDGSARITGTTDNYSAVISAVVAGAEESLSATIGGVIAGNTAGLGTLDLEIETPIAHARATGSLVWSPALAVDVLLLTDNLDPSAFVPVSTGAINSELRVIASGADAFSVDIISLTGTWNEQPASGRGHLSRRANTWQCAECAINVGENHINVDGVVDGAMLAGNIDIDAPSLQQLWPGLAGSLAGDGRMQGTLALPRLSGRISGDNLGFADWQIASLSLQSGDSTLQNIDVAIELAGLANGESRLGSGRLSLAGQPASVDLTAAWTLDDFAVASNAQLTIDGDTVDGRILSASLTEPYTGSWAIEEPIAFHIAQGQLGIEPGAWVNGDAQFSHERLRVEDDLIVIDMALANGPLRVLNLVLPDRMQIDGLADAMVNIVQKDGAWSGDIQWQQQNTSMLFRSERGEEIIKQLPVAGATIRLDDNTADLQARVKSDSGLDLSINAMLGELSTDAEFEAQLTLSGDQWDWVPLLIPDIDNIEGPVTADVRASGTLDSPDLSGELHWQDGKLAMPALNLLFSEIDVTLTGTSAGDMSIAGKAMSGNGSLGINGRLENVTSRSPTFTVQLSGNRADLLNWPDYQLTASPDLTFAGDTAGVLVTGRVDLDRAEIAIRELPEDAVSLSDDVTVEGREAANSERTRISGEIEITLSDDIHIQAFGLDTNLEGQLRFVVPNDGEPQAHGEVRLVGGLFEAYGQRLQIEQGTMVFTGPLDDPIINVRATRKIESINGTVTAGINLAGRAQNLSSTIFSDPSMSEADALSYLVLGRPLEDATAADGSNLSNTAYSLGLRQAALITNQIGQTVGLDELTVGGNNQNTTELVAGKQVNSRLYARYAYGVFTRLGHLLLRYRLSQSFSVEIGAGETQSMDILYTIETE